MEEIKCPMVFGPNTYFLSRVTEKAEENLGLGSELRLETLIKSAYIGDAGRARLFLKL